MFRMRALVNATIEEPLTGWMEAAVDNFLLACLSAGVQPEWAHGGAHSNVRLASPNDAPVDWVLLAEWLGSGPVVQKAALHSGSDEELWLYICRDMPAAPLLHRTVRIWQALHAQMMGHSAILSDDETLEMNARLHRRRAQAHALWSPLSHGAYPRRSRAAIIALLVLHAHGPAALRRLDGWLLHRLLSAVAATFRQYY